MNIKEMHVAFRQYAQQMGMQNVRAILPEQIDLLINTSISDTVNQIIRENVGVTSDRMISDNSKVGTINSLKSLYKVEEINFYDKIGIITTIKSNIPYYRIKESESSHLLTNNPLFVIDFAVNYTKGIVANGQADLDWFSNFYPVRQIDDIYLADVINDFVLAPRFRSPIITVNNNNNNNNNNSADSEYGKEQIVHNQNYELYFGIGEATENVNVNGEDPVSKPVIRCGTDFGLSLYPYQLRVSYLARPNRVRYLEDANDNSVNCDLPEYMHVDIIKHAVDLYHIALQGSIHAAQQAQQQQQQENVRNYARPTNSNSNNND